MMSATNSQIEVVTTSRRSCTLGYTGLGVHGEQGCNHDTGQALSLRFDMTMCVCVCACAYVCVYIYIHM